MPKIAVLLSGCGFYDGSEISESVLTLLAIDRAKSEALCIAPDMEQNHTINHSSGEIVKEEKRNILIEAARIARGRIKKLEEIEISTIDALIIPGGFGIAKNLSDFSLKGKDFKVNEKITKLLLTMFQEKKPLGFICIAPIIAAKIFNKNITLTVGEDQEVSLILEKLGANVLKCSAKDCIVDKEHKIVSTPAYMYGEARLSEIAAGIDQSVQALIELIE